MPHTNVQAPPATDTDWAQLELSTYFKKHPDLLQPLLDKILDRLRVSQGDMPGFCVELDGMIDELNDRIDEERRDVVGRTRLMRDYPEVTNEFLHFFLDGIMEAMEKEQAGAAAGPGAVGRSGSGAGRRSGAGGILAAAGPLRTSSVGSSGGGGGGASSGKERFSSVPRRMQG